MTLSLKPFHINLAFEAGTQDCGAGTFTVPCNQVLVIETIGVDVQIPANQQVLCATLTLATPERRTSFPIPVQSLGTISPSGAAAETRYSGLHAVRIYAEPGSQVTFALALNSRNAGPQVTCSLAGYLTGPD